MTLSQLRTFIAVAEDGSVRAAAERLHVSQPSVSGSIAALSDEVGVPLTERDGRGMKLSPAGAAFLPHAIEALGLLELGTRMAQSAADRVSATVRIAAVYTAAESLLPPLLRAFREEHPEIPIQLEIGNREVVLDLLPPPPAAVLALRDLRQLRAAFRPPLPVGGAVRRGEKVFLFFFVLGGGVFWRGERERDDNDDDR